MPGQISPADAATPPVSVLAGVGGWVFKESYDYLGLEEQRRDCLGQFKVVSLPHRDFLSPGLSLAALRLFFPVCMSGRSLVCPAVANKAMMLASLRIKASSLSLVRRSRGFRPIVALSPV
jgi:hypothetical protein